MVENTGATLWLERGIATVIFVNFVICLIRTEPCYCPELPSSACVCYRVDPKHLGNMSSDASAEHDNKFLETLDPTQLQYEQVRRRVRPFAHTRAGTCIFDGSCVCRVSFR